MCSHGNFSGLAFMIPQQLTSKPKTEHSLTLAPSAQHRFIQVLGAHGTWI